MTIRRTCIPFRCKTLLLLAIFSLLDDITGTRYLFSVLKPHHSDFRGPQDPREDRGIMDVSESVKWYRLAAEQGLADAQYTLGFMYIYGHGVEKDHWQAVVWFRRAAAAGPCQRSA